MSETTLVAAKTVKIGSLIRFHGIRYVIYGKRRNVNSNTVELLLSLPNKHRPRYNYITTLTENSLVSIY